MLFFSVIFLFPQSKMTLDNAINAFAIELQDILPKNSRVAVVSFATNRRDLTIYFIDSMVGKISGKENNDVKVYERKDIEILQKELNFSLTGDVSDETAQLIGHFVGANMLVYGSMVRLSNDEYRMTIKATVTETAEILLSRLYDLRLDSRLRGLLGIAKKEPGDEVYYRVVGASVGTSFAEPWIIGTVHGTVAPFRYSFLEIGLDLGLVSGFPDVVEYYSMYPFAHYAIFVPFSIVSLGGSYFGAGVGYMFGERTYQDLKDSIRIIAADFIVGLNIFNTLDISYTLRTNFKSVSNKFSLGYTYRFN